MNSIIIIRYGEIHLKGGNREFFINRLLANIRRALSGYTCKVSAMSGRFCVDGFDIESQGGIISALKSVFGITSISAGVCCAAEIGAIKDLCVALYDGKSTFKIQTNRADKRFALTSIEVSREVGGAVLQAHKNAVVDLHNPEQVIEIDIRENGTAFVFLGRTEGLGGMPVGTSGRALLLLSGGIDSPVAGFLAAKRGLCVDSVHFESFPYTSIRAKQKVMDLFRQTAPLCGARHISFVGVTKIQESINRHCADNYQITILRRCMLKIAQTLALKNGYGCLISGESLGQVASQTLESITATSSVASLPIIRPLICMDKAEIIAIARKIGTYETSILPYEDCCTVFLPAHPSTKPNISRCEFEESKIEQLDELLSEAISSCEVVKL